MPTVTIAIHSTKPANKLFFPQSSDANLALVQSLNEWTKSQPGFISQTSTDPTPDSRIVTLVWNGLENYTAWYSARESRPEQVARRAYNTSNGITSFMQETIT